MKNFKQNKAVLVVVFKTRAVYVKSVYVKSIKRFESHFTKQKIIFQHYYQLYWDYLLKLGHKWRASSVWTAKFKRLQEVEFHSIRDALIGLSHF